MIVTLGRAPEHHPVRVERRRGDGRALALLEEARVGFDARELLAAKVEHLD